MKTKLNIHAEIVTRPLKSAFVISRGAKTDAVSLLVTITGQGLVGRGEGVPYPRYGEDIDAVLAALNAIGEIDPDANPAKYVAGYAAQNALDCALVDWQAKAMGKPGAELLGLAELTPVQTAQTLSLGAPEEMAKAASALSDDALIKIKLGGAGDIERLRAIRNARPKARLIVDANEGWGIREYTSFVPQCVELGIEMIEQPFHADDDGALATLQRPIPICADEAAHNAEGVAQLADRYDMINIKLDKTGGIRPAVEMARRADDLDMPYMIGCMVAGSLAMAPAMLLATGARFVDLDGPLFVAQDIDNGIHYQNGIMHPYSSSLWG